MQITFIRHGSYMMGDGHLNERGIEQMTCSAMALQDISDKRKGTIREEPYHLNDKHPDIIVPKPTYTDYLHVLNTVSQRICIQSEADPDLIITSRAERAMESGVVIQEQLKKMGTNADLKTGVAYFNEIDTDGIHFNGLGYISEEQLPQLCQQESVQKAKTYLKKLAAEGHKHVVILTHQPNIQVMGYALRGNCHVAPPKNGDLMTIYSDPNKQISYCQLKSNNPELEKNIKQAAYSVFQPLPTEKIQEKLKKFRVQITNAIVKKKENQK